MRTRPSIPARRSRARSAAVATLALLLVLAGLLAACGEDEEAGTSEAATAAPATSAASTAEPADSTGDAAATSEPSSPSESEATAPETDATAPASTDPVGSTEATSGRPVAIYLVRNERVSPVRRYVDPAAPAKPTLEALLAGPTDGDGDRTTAIPEGASLLGVSIDGDGILTADLSQEFTSGGGSLSIKLRAAQIVYTATQFPTVKGVLFAVEGEPVETLGGEGLIVDRPQTRADYEDETPAVLVEEPLPGDTPQCPVRARGTSNVFEATSLLAIAPPGELTSMPTDPTVVTATSGTGTRGTFDVEVPCPADLAGQDASLVSWWESAKDGSAQGVEAILIHPLP
jgi:spore germination protein GerM